MKKTTILAAVLIAVAGSAYAANVSAGEDIDEDVVAHANASQANAINALNSANASLNQLAHLLKASAPGTASAASVTVPETGVPVVSAFAKAQEVGANDWVGAEYKEIVALKTIIERGLPGACALRKTEILGGSLHVTVADTNNGTVIPLELAFSGVFFSYPPGSSLQVSSEWRGRQFYAVEFPFGLWGNASRHLSLKVHNGKVSELQIYQEEKTLTGGTKKASVICGR